MESRSVQTARFAIARFVPDLVRGDGYNIGVILQSRDGGWIDAKFDPAAERVADLWPNINRNVIVSYVDGIKRVVSPMPAQARIGLHQASSPVSPHDAEFLPFLASTAGNTIQVVDVQEIRITRPLHEELARLYARYVGREEKARSPVRQPIERSVRDALRTADLVRPGALRPIRDPILGRRESHPIQFLGYNSVPHAIHAHDLTGARAVDIANAWRGRYQDMAAIGSSIERVQLHMFVKIPAGVTTSEYTPAAILGDEPGIRVYTSVVQGVDALTDVFMDH